MGQGNTVAMQLKYLWTMHNIRVPGDTQLVFYLNKMGD